MIFSQWFSSLFLNVVYNKLMLCVWITSSHGVLYHWSIAGVAGFAGLAAECGSLQLSAEDILRYGIRSSKLGKVHTIVKVFKYYKFKYLCKEYLTLRYRSKICQWLLSNKHVTSPILTPVWFMLEFERRHTKILSSKYSFCPISPRRSQTDRHLSS